MVVLSHPVMGSINAKQDKNWPRSRPAVPLVELVFFLSYSGPQWIRNPNKYVKLLSYGFNGLFCPNSEVAIFLQLFDYYREFIMKRIFDVTIKKKQLVRFGNKPVNKNQIWFLMFLYFETACSSSRSFWNGNRRATIKRILIDNKFAALTNINLWKWHFPFTSFIIFAAWLPGFWELG
jgi:hypothetical protein